MTTISWLMLCREITIVYSENCMKHTRTLCRQNAELMNVKAGGTYRDHHALKYVLIIMTEIDTPQPKNQVQKSLTWTVFYKYL
jgi:hypothetical protein